MFFTSIIKDLSESKFRSIILYFIIFAATLLPGVLILDVYNKELLLTVSFGLAVLYALAITVPLFIVNFIVFIFTGSPDLDDELLDDDVFEELIFYSLLSSGLVCFFGYHLFILFSNLVISRFGYPPSNDQVIKVVFITEFLFIIFRSIFVAKGLNRINKSNKRM